MTYINNDHGPRDLYRIATANEREIAQREEFERAEARNAAQIKAYMDRLWALVRAVRRRRGTAINQYHKAAQQLDAILKRLDATVPPQERGARYARARQQILGGKNELLDLAADVELKKEKGAA